MVGLCAREGAANSVAEQLGTSRSNLYKLKKELDILNKAVEIAQKNRASILES
ncbi:MAG: hypothetical protein GXX08_10505 [Firmicutes bacterium]|nr:hypothetical protein [Bacillota bacterium]